MIKLSYTLNKLVEIYEVILNLKVQIERNVDIQYIVLEIIVKKICIKCYSNTNH